jgi:gamma-glutamylcyclotransferase (GGCT)/AIG2-like uncharacterized protein YtfP
MLNVFVYGTLKPGHINYQVYCQGHVEDALAAQVRGKLFHLPLGYPAMTCGAEWVKGFLLRLRHPSLLRQLDDLEGYSPQRSPEQNEYCRQWVEVFDQNAQPLGQAWAYLMTLQKVKQFGGQWLASGQWR